MGINEERLVHGLQNLFIANFLLFCSRLIAVSSLEIIKRFSRRL